jgi:hypothetical protein
LADPDRDRHPGPAHPDPFQPNVKLAKLYFFSQKISIYCKNIENYDICDVDEKKNDVN